jgi:hypothetical protein
VREAQKLGFTKVYVPKNNLGGWEAPEGIEDYFYFFHYLKTFLNVSPIVETPIISIPSGASQPPRLFLGT